LWLGWPASIGPVAVAVAIVVAIVDVVWIHLGWLIMRAEELQTLLCLANLC